MMTSTAAPTSRVAHSDRRHPANGAAQPAAPAETATDIRLRRLQNACELLADGFDGLDESIAEYIVCTPLPPGDCRGADADRFLDWLERNAGLDSERRDFVAALRGRRAVEFVVVAQRLAHARFQELLRHTNSRIDQLSTNDRLTIHLNPVHIWSQFETRALLDDEAEIPASVLFVPCGWDVRMVVIEPAARTLIDDLAAAGPQQVKDLLRRTARDQWPHRLDVVRQLAAVGVVALA